MDCKQYKKLRSRFSKLPLPKDIWDSEEYEDWSDHFQECSDCSDWELGERVKQRGEDPSSFPCVHLAYHATEKCKDHNHDPHECPDIIIVQSEDKKEFGIPIKDGGLSRVEIKYCPWCGNKI